MFTPQMELRFMQEQIRRLLTLLGKKDVCVKGDDNVVIYLDRREDYPAFLDLVCEFGVRFTAYTDLCEITLWER